MKIEVIRSDITKLAVDATADFCNSIEKIIIARFGEERGREFKGVYNFV